MFRRIFPLFAMLTVLSVLFSACAQSPETTSGKLNVVATTTFIGDVTAQIGGDLIDLSVMMPAGADPHSFEPAPADLSKVADADLVLVNGIEFEAFLEKLIENAGDEAKVVTVSEGIETIAFVEGADEHADEDHSPEAHSGEVCEQLEGKTAEEEIQSGAEAASAMEMHGEEHAEDEHAHAREIITVKLNAQADGTFAGYLLFDSEAEQGYAFTSAGGVMTIRDAAGTVLEAEQTLTIDCGGMTVGDVYKLPVGAYVIAITGAAVESVAFSAAPMHPEEHEHADEEHAHEHGEFDPHVWQDPNNVIVWVNQIADALSAQDSANATTYRANADAYIAELQTLDTWIKEQIAQIPEANRRLVTEHGTLGYFAARYGFEVVGTAIPGFSTLAEPSAQELAALADDIRDLDVKAIFVGNTVNPNVASQIAQDTGIQLIPLYTDSLSPADGPAATYLDFMKFNVEAIVGALK